MASVSSSDPLFVRALRTIPWGTQTNAKRPQPAMDGAMPAFIERASGSRMYSPDGREFIDYRAALGPIVLGYCYPAVDRAVRAQLEKGVLFSMASPVEMQAAESVAAMVPGAERVRFLKSGADASAAALRMARAYTGRAKFISCGYHGWHDTFAAARQGLDRGVPSEMRQYEYTIRYGDAEAAERVMAEHGNEIAAIFTVPYDLGDEGDREFLARLKQAAKKNGSLLIYDEIITGFRLAPGGGSAYFDVTPDLLVLGKAMANGFPVAAFAGSSAVMGLLDQDRVLITTTYAGEALSLAACQATLQVMRDEPVHEHIWRVGKAFMSGMEEAGRLADVPLHAFGLPPVSGLTITGVDTEKCNAAMQAFNREMYLQGIFANGNWFISYSHSEADIAQTLEKAVVALKAARASL
jgi:glutamate-1-semialdehyde 2,1-aminomutase